MEVDTVQVRAATAKDNARLIAIEHMTPQGEQIKLVSERKDYFVRAKKFDQPILLVAEDEAQEAILGVMGVGPVSVRLGGEVVRGGFIFDWRSNPLAQQGLPRHMLRLWQGVQKEIARQELQFVFGYVKADNERTLGLLHKFGAKKVDEKEFLTMPVHARFSRDQARVSQVLLTRTIDPQREAAILREKYGNLDFFSEISQSADLMQQRQDYLFGKLSYEKSSVKIWDTNAEYTQRVLNMPLVYKVLRPAVHAASKIVSLPRIPRLGDEIRVWQLYDLILDQPDHLFYLLERARLAAKENNIDYLVICMSTGDGGYEQAASKAWVRLKYHVIFVPMTELPMPKAPTYFDVSYL